MRILHIVGSINPAAGGPTEVIRMLVHYAPPGYENEAVTLDDPAAPFLADFPFPIHALGGPTKSWYSPKLIPWLRSNRSRFDGIIVHGLWEFTGLATLIAHGPVPYVVFPHGMLDPYFKRRYPTKHLKKWIYWAPAEYWVLRSAERALFTTAIERDLARQSFWLNRWTPMVMALGSEPPPADTARLLAAFHERVPSIGSHRFLLFLGRIDRKKGCDLLIEAFASISNQDPTLHLVMAGPDATNWQMDLQSTADAAGCGNRVHWPGMLRGDAKWGAFAACEAFILPSHQENFGIAVVEALASGKPVLLSDQINIAPDIKSDFSGFVENDTSEGTKKLIRAWINAPQNIKKHMSANALKTFANRYDMRKNTEAILRVFDRNHSKETV
jgi:glycosyltransferase involved in cell wall biosynthesis